MVFVKHKTVKSIFLTCSIIATLATISYFPQKMNDTANKTKHSEIITNTQKIVTGYQSQSLSNNVKASKKQDCNLNSFIKIKEPIQKFRENLENDLIELNSTIKNVKYITSVADPKNIDYIATAKTIEYNIEYDSSNEENSVIPDHVQIVDNNNVVAEVPVKKEENDETIKVNVKLENEDLKWGKDYTIRGVVSEQFKIIDEDEKENRYYFSSNGETTTLFSNDTEIHAEPAIPKEHTQSITHIFLLPNNTSIYNLDKSEVGLTVEGFFTGCHDSDYPGFIKINADHFDYLIEDNDNIIEYNNGTILPTGSISQLGENKPMLYGCGPTCVEMLAKWEKNKDFSKDSSSTYTGWRIDELNIALSKAGNARSVFTSYNASKTLVAAKAKGLITEISSYENGVRSKEYNSICFNDIKNEIINQLNNGHRIIACVEFSNTSGSFKDQIIADDYWNGLEHIQSEITVSNYLIDVIKDSEGYYNVPMNSIEGLEYFYQNSEYLKSHYNNQLNMLRFTHEERDYLYYKMKNDVSELNKKNIKQHFVVITGYRETQDGIKFYIADPYYSSNATKGYSKYGVSYLYGLIEIDADYLSKSVLNCSDGLSYYTD